jgi:hypothetical protein
MQDTTQNADQHRRDEGREVRARCWAYILACFEEKKAAEEHGVGHDDKEYEDIHADEGLPHK